MLYFQALSWDYYSCLINFSHQSIAVPSKGEVREISCHWMGWGRSEGLMVLRNCVHTTNISRESILELYWGECLPTFDLGFWRGVGRVLLCSVLGTFFTWLFLKCLTFFSMPLFSFSLSWFLFKELPTGIYSLLFSLLVLISSLFLLDSWDHPQVNPSHWLLKFIRIWLLLKTSLVGKIQFWGFNNQEILLGSSKNEFGIITSSLFFTSSLKAHQAGCQGLLTHCSLCDLGQSQPFSVSQSPSVK